MELTIAAVTILSYKVICWPHMPNIKWQDGLSNSDWLHFVNTSSLPAATIYLFFFFFFFLQSYWINTQTLDIGILIGIEIKYIGVYCCVAAITVREGVMKDTTGYSAASLIVMILYWVNSSTETRFYKMDLSCGHVSGLDYKHGKNNKTQLTVNSATHKVAF